ncbi:cycloinulo-oligosaccharide fructanotransferase [Pseudoalteromonas fuliginea]|uniref:Cycloinulo-oligosaccharide fructanotransferase n=2 Tax=Pseudoalteromonas fuliginea TaxID=1872678 RepID=A0ABQ6RK39_9GAMM|nr:cycloinulo-oligosaccharide fructanotransferase [Pseudoalteromonas fuliginea]KAA1168131.1 cycloinulo-oligosaccharide fructanotransferase [Pseudoalteromonas fuliginea]
MSMTEQMTKHQQQLLAAYLAGEDVADELLEACQHDVNLLAQVSKYVTSERLLKAHHQSDTRPDNFTRSVMAKLSEQQKTIWPKSTMSWFSSPYALAASIMLFVSVIFLAEHLDYTNKFAEVTKMTASHNANFSVGSQLGQGDIILEHGYSEILLENGVVLVLEAPVKVNLQSRDKVTLHHGKLVARVPQNAIGFRVDTPSSEIIDLGTEFGVEVSNSGESQVHVLDGEIKARGNKTQSYQHVKKDQALAFDLNHQITSFVSVPSDFMRVLPGDSIEEPHLLHWSFDDKQQHNYLSIGRGIDGQQYVAKDKSPIDEPLTEVAGVYDKAISFNGENNWLETQYPGVGSDNPRTVAFWLKVPSDFLPENAYGIVSWGLQQDYSAWQISPNPELIDGPLGRIRIGTYNAQIVGNTDLRDDEWHHIAVVLYGGLKSNLATHVLLYVDGKLEKTQKKSIAKVATNLQHPASRPLTIGKNIGYIEGATHEKQMFFKGGLDELYVVEAALNQQQIIQLMTHNQLNE